MSNFIHNLEAIEPKKTKVRAYSLENIVFNSIYCELRFNMLLFLNWKVGFLLKIAWRGKVWQIWGSFPGGVSMDWFCSVKVRISINFDAYKSVSPHYTDFFFRLYFYLKNLFNLKVKSKNENYECRSIHRCIWAVTSDSFKSIF